MKLILKLVLGLVCLVVLGGAVLAGLVVATAGFDRATRSACSRRWRPIRATRRSLWCCSIRPCDKPRLLWLGAAMAELAPGAGVAGDRLPVVVVSHGTGGTAFSHLDTVLALVEAGYVVAAPIHPGDNFQDSAKVGTSDWIVDRARHIARVDDFVLGAWAGRTHLDPTRLGFFGFSAGGTTGLVALGGKPDFAAVAPHCAAHPEFACALMKQGAVRVPTAAEWVHDPRIKAAVIVAPGLDFAFEPDGLRDVGAPVQLWEGDADTALPYASNAGAVRRLLPVAPEFHMVPGAAHFSFLAPCGMVRALLPPMLCADPKGFDRTAFHRAFDTAVVAFLDAKLRRSPTP